MAQHDYIIANQSGAAFRADLNNGLAAIVSQNSGSAQPSPTYAYQWWADTTTGLLKIRNAANNAWITIGTLADVNLGLLSLAGGTLTGALLADDSGTAALPAIAFDGDPDTGAFRAGANELGIATSGSERVRLGAAGQIGIGGATYGTSGQVLTSGGASAAPTWADSTSSDNISEGNTSAEVVDTGSDGHFKVTTEGSERLRVTASGLVGIGTTSPVTALDVNGDVTITDKIIHAGDTDTAIRFSAADTVAVETGGSQRVSFDSSAITVSDGYNVVLGTTTGTKIGTGTTQKIGFYNATPVVQPAAIANASDGTTAIIRLNALLDRMRDLGLIAT